MTTRSKVHLIGSVIFIAGLATLLFIALAGCGISSKSDASIDNGVVTKVQYAKKGSYRITVLEDDGEDDAYKVSANVAAKCSVGKRWPDCKR